MALSKYLRSVNVLTVPCWFLVLQLFHCLFATWSPVVFVSVFVICCIDGDCFCRCILDVMSVMRLLCAACCVCVSCCCRWCCCLGVCLCLLLFFVVFVYLSSFAHSARPRRKVVMLGCYQML